jgi:hypothetical protein
MPKQTIDTTKRSLQPDVVINENMRDYSQEPFFIKKKEQAISTLKKYGLPKELQNRITKK